MGNSKKIFLKEINLIRPVEDVLSNKKVNDKQIKKITNTYVKEVDKFLKKSNIELTAIDDTIYIGAEEPLTINYGATSIGIIDNKRNKVIQITVDNIKVAWLSINPYIKIHDFSIIKVDDNKYVYLIELEKLEILSTEDIEKNKKLNTFFRIITEDIYKAVNSLLNDTNITLIENDIIPKLEKEKIPKEIIEQMKLFVTIVKLYTGVGVYLDVDYNNTNIGKNNKGKYVILDPVYSRSLWASKISNVLHPLVYENIQNKIRNS